MAKRYRVHSWKHCFHTAVTDHYFRTAVMGHYVFTAITATIFSHSHHRPRFWHNNRGPRFSHSSHRPYFSHSNHRLEHYFHTAITDTIFTQHAIRDHHFLHRCHHIIIIIILLSLLSRRQVTATRNVDVLRSGFSWACMKSEFGQLLLAKGKHSVMDAAWCHKDSERVTVVTNPHGNAIQWLAEESKRKTKMVLKMSCGLEPRRLVKHLDKGIVSLQSSQTRPRRPPLKGRERHTVSSDHVGTVSMAALGKLVTEGTESTSIGFSERIHTTLNCTEQSWTELNDPESRGPITDRKLRKGEDRLYIAYTISGNEPHSSGAVWESRWPSWAVRPNEPSGFRGRKAILNHASALVSACP